MFCFNKEISANNSLISGSIPGHDERRWVELNEIYIRGQPSRLHHMRGLPHSIFSSLFFYSDFAAARISWLLFYNLFYLIPNLFFIVFGTISYI